MKNVIAFGTLLVALVAVVSCRQETTPTPTIEPDPVFSVPFFNQINTEFRGSQANTLLNFWYKGRSRQSVEFAAINDQKAYQAFFDQTSADSLPRIDFTRYTLLIGTRGGYGSFMDGPANIKRIEQDLQQQATGDWQYTVTISSRSRGGE